MSEMTSLMNEREHLLESDNEEEEVVQVKSKNWFIYKLTSIASIGGFLFG